MVASTTISCLPDEALLYIFTCVNQYCDLDSVRIVCRRWYFLANKAIGIMKRAFMRCDQFQWHLYRYLDSVTCRYYHSTCYHESSKSMLVFGGCTTDYTVFNDLWQFDLSSRIWKRVVIRRSPFPSPKALASLVSYGDDVILYGGFSKSYPNPIRHISKYYDELHLFKFSEQRWIELIAENEGPKLAGHSAVIVDDSMIVFGGVSGELSSNKVHIFDIERSRWWSPEISSRDHPSPRCSHSQALIDRNHLLIFGGSVGPSEVSNSGSCNYALSDLWLLKFDLNRPDGWEWKKIKVINQEVSPWQLWLHAACSVGHNIVALVSHCDTGADLRKEADGLYAPSCHENSSLRRRFVENGNLKKESAIYRASTFDKESSYCMSSKQQNSIFLPGDKHTCRNSSSKDSNSRGISDRKLSPSRNKSLCSDDVPGTSRIQSENSSANIVGPSDYSCRRRGSSKTFSDCRIDAGRINCQADINPHCYNSQQPPLSNSTTHGFSGGSLTTSQKPVSAQERFKKCSFLRRRLNVFILDISLAVAQGTARWRKQYPEKNAPYDMRSYSVCAGRGELIVFGGVLMEHAKSNSCLNRQLSSNNTYILQPRYTI